DPSLCDVVFCHKADIVEDLDESSEGFLSQIASALRCREVEAALEVAAEPPRRVLLAVDAPEGPPRCQPALREPFEIMRGVCEGWPASHRPRRAALRRAALARRSRSSPLASHSAGA